MILDTSSFFFFIFFHFFLDEIKCKTIFEDVVSPRETRSVCEGKHRHLYMACVTNVITQNGAALWNAIFSQLFHHFQSHPANKDDDRESYRKNDRSVHPEKSQQNQMKQYYVRRSSHINSFSYSSTRGLLHNKMSSNLFYPRRKNTIDNTLTNVRTLTKRGFASTKDQSPPRPPIPQRARYTAVSVNPSTRLIPSLKAKIILVGSPNSMSPLTHPSPVDLASPSL